MTVELPSGPISGIVVKGVCVCLCMLVYMLRCIWLPSALHELNFNMVQGGRSGVQLNGGWGKGRLRFCFDLATLKLCALPC